MILPSFVPSFTIAIAMLALHYYCEVQSFSALSEPKMKLGKSKQVQALLGMATWKLGKNLWPL